MYMHGHFTHAAIMMAEELWALPNRNNRFGAHGSDLIAVAFLQPENLTQTEFTYLRAMYEEYLRRS